MPKRLLLFYVVMIGMCLARPNSFAAISISQRDDHLVPVNESFKDSEGKLAVYRRLTEGKLFVTSGNMARFLHLPGMGGVETAVSIYQDGDKKGGLAGGCWLTLTQASRLLWTFMWHATDESGNLQSVEIERRDVPLPETTAEAVREAWLVMLMQSKEPSRHLTTIDSSTEIYSAVNRSGRILSACSPPYASENTSALLDLTNKLIECCYLTATERSQKIRELETAARILSDKARKQTRKRVVGGQS